MPAWKTSALRFKVTYSVECVGGSDGCCSGVVLYAKGVADKCHQPASALYMLSARAASALYMLSARAASALYMLSAPQRAASALYMLSARPLAPPPVIARFGHGARVVLFIPLPVIVLQPAPETINIFYCNWMLLIQRVYYL